MAFQGEFFKDEEVELMEGFLKNGFVSFPLNELSGIDQIREDLYAHAMKWLNLKNPPSLKEFFDHTQEYVSVEKLNALRVHLIDQMNRDSSLRVRIYRAGRDPIQAIVGNELAMQRVANLSIQLPHDTSSLLPLHSDVWSGNSPYEVVFWIPLVDCYESKSMYALPYEKSQEIFKNFPEFAHLDAESLYKKIEPEVIRFKVPYGQGAIFSHSLLHGNRVNEEPTTRWTINIRFKSLLSPYGTKEVGETFQPITIRPLTRVGYHYIKPRIK